MGKDYPEGEVYGSGVYWDCWHPQPARTR